MGRDPVAFSGGNERKVNRRLGDHLIDAVGKGAQEMKMPAQNVPATHSSSNRSEVRSEFRALERWVSWMVPSIVVANFTVFWVTMYVNNCPANSSSCMVRFLGRFAFQPFKENPFLGPSALTLENMGALDVDKVAYEHQVWRLISCVWLHAGIFHILANMLSLLFIGIRLEQEFGFVRIGIIYLISGFGGSLLSSLFFRSGISVGASGALFGLLGGMVSEIIMNWTIYTNKFVALTTLLLITLLNLAMGILPHVDNFAHIGGFLSGFLLGFVFLIRPQFGWTTQKNSDVRSSSSSSSSSPVESKHKLYQYVLWLLALALLIIGFTLGLVALMRGDDMNEYCSWCHYLTCVPTSKWSCKKEASCSNISTGDNQFNMTCLSNGRSRVYAVTDTNNSSSWVLELCSQLCS